MLRHRTALAVVALTLGFVMFDATPVAADSSSNYSHAWENTGGNFQGMSNYRTDRAVSGLPSNYCSSPYGYDVVYQPMWFAVAGSGNNFELGTGQQCNDTYRYWYWGLSVNGVYTSLGYQTGISNGPMHTFQIERQVQGPDTIDIVYTIDGVTKLTHPTTAGYGVTLDVGLESHCSGCSVAWYDNYTLKYKKSGVWNYWSGRDGKQVNDPPMCGSWNADDVWISGQVASC